MRIYSLAEFPSPPPLGTVTLEETNGIVYNEPETDGALRNFHLDTFPEMPFVRLQEELARPSSTLTMSAKSCILRQLPSDQWARLCEAYVDHGIYGLLDHVSSAETTPPLSAFAGCAKLTLNCYHCVGRVYTFVRGLFFPQLQLSPEEICSGYSEVANWSSGIVRAMAWHPNTKKLAIALRNDSVILYNKNSPISSELKHTKQRNVTCIAFRPFSGSHIAVGCEQGLLLWNIPAAIMVKTPTMHSATQYLPGTMISSISWHPAGNLLAACSARFGDIVVLSAATGEVVPLTTFSILPSAHLLRWSRDGFRIFAACPNGGFNIWEGNPVWDAERYSSVISINMTTTACGLSKIVTTACWSYDGCQLLFTVQGEPRVYQLSLNPVGEPMAAAPRPRPVVSLEGHPDGISGEVSMMEWDRNCQRLAIAFKHPSPLIAVFATKIKPLFDLKPLTFLRGPSAPEAMKFCEDQIDGGTLTVCWSTGQVHHIPMHFEVAAGDRSIVLSRSAVSELSGDFSNDSASNLRG